MQEAIAKLNKTRQQAGKCAEMDRDFPKPSSGMNTPNRLAARRAREILDTCYDLEEPVHVRLRDLLTDLRHLADEEDLDFYATLGGSYEVYLDERTDA